MRRKVCGCYRGGDGRWWKHAAKGGQPEYASCERWGMGCSHPCPGPKHALDVDAKAEDEE